jgi:conjugative transfer signal peptidase TraF
MRRRFVLSVSAFAIVGLFAAAVPHQPLLIWNASASAPIGLYSVSAAKVIARGDLVLALPPAGAQRLAAERGYLPLGVPLVKYVAALQGDRVCAVGLQISINDTEAAIRLLRDSAGRPLPLWYGCRTLAQGDVFLLNHHVLHSFDGRYFGVIPRSNIIGKLKALWLP